MHVALLLAVLGAMSSPLPVGTHRIPEENSPGPVPVKVAGFLYSSPTTRDPAREARVSRELTASVVTALRAQAGVQVVGRGEGAEYVVSGMAAEIQGQVRLEVMLTRVADGQVVLKRSFKMGSTDPTDLAAAVANVVLSWVGATASG